MLYGYLRHLANFAHVVEVGSITGAANRLGLSPSVVSESVKTLEARLGEPLLERRRSGVHPTARGLSMAEEARRIVDALDRALGGEEETEGPLTGPLRISLPSELAHGWFDRALHKLMADHPDLDLKLLLEDTPADYSKYGRDLFIRVGLKAEYSDLRTLAHATAEIVLVAAPKLAAHITPGDLAAIQTLPFLASTEKTGAAEMRIRMDGPAKTLRFPHVLRVSNIGARLSMMRAGLGAMGCLRPSVNDDIEAGQLIDLVPGQSGFAKVHAVIGSPHRRHPRPCTACRRSPRPRSTRSNPCEIRCAGVGV